jgi:hypothetical protein
VADIIRATPADEDFERDSLVSQSSRTTARVRIQDKFVKVATMYKDECTSEKIKERIRDIAVNAMAKSVTYEEIDAADKAYGGFKKRNVLAAHDLYHLTEMFSPICMHFAAISINVQEEPVCG